MHHRPSQSRTHTTLRPRCAYRDANSVSRVVYGQFFAVGPGRFKFVPQRRSQRRMQEHLSGLRQIITTFGRRIQHCCSIIEHCFFRRPTSAGPNTRWVHLLPRLNNILPPTFISTLFPGNTSCHNSITLSRRVRCNLASRWSARAKFVADKIEHLVVHQLSKVQKVEKNMSWP